MKLSVVIVNYNVKFFLEQCLISVQEALKGIEGEVFVVDNASADGSCQMVQQRFSWVKLIENKINHGFSFANNQALRHTQGEYVLLLNPDTVVEEDTFSKCISFMDRNPQAGSLSVKMIDGKGNFLPESKRALPSPMVSFYKIFGLSRLFPKSKVFARYHLGHLDENKTHEIEILPGAFMFIRKNVLDKVGLLDETFFMYGEDIDLSYRILLEGFKNYYLHETTIIHYKGESTKKGSINYVLIFYKAMMIFARKHFSRKNASLYIALIYLAIYFRAFLSIAKRFLKRVWQPITDAAIIAIGISIIIPFWELHRFNSHDVYPDKLVILLSGVYISIWVLSCWLSGAYDRPRRLFASTKGISIGTLIILAGYALLPEDVRFSRAIILLTTAWSILLLQLANIIFGVYQKDAFSAFRKRKRIAIVGTPNEVERVLGIIQQAGIEHIFVGQISPSNKTTHSEQIATINQLPEFVRVNNTDEIIFCSGDISSQDIIKTMLSLVQMGVDYKIAPPDSLSIIGSNSIDTAGDLYTIEFSAISKASNRRQKRFFDLSTAFFFILFAPLLVLLIRKYWFVFKKSFGVLVGRYTWIGYIEHPEIDLQGLPKIKRGVFPPYKVSKRSDLDVAVMDRINILYAKNYSIISEFYLLWQNI